MLDSNELLLIEQKAIFKQEFDNWKGELEQVDDVCIMGIRLSYKM